MDCTRPDDSRGAAQVTADRPIDSLVFRDTVSYGENAQG
jgi:hypothetical protein